MDAWRGPHCLDEPLVVLREDGLCTAVEHVEVGLDWYCLHRLPDDPGFIVKRKPGDPDPCEMDISYEAWCYHGRGFELVEDSG